MTHTISSSDDVIDSRDVIERIEELTDERDDAAEAGGDELAAWEQEYGAELKALESLAEEASGSPDWQHGETLIRDSYFKQYAEEFASDIGRISGDMEWPLCHIDWDAAAEDLKQDYTSVEFDGVTYWIR
jgi:hypothetical protein